MQFCFATGLGPLRLKTGRLRLFDELEGAMELDLRRRLREAWLRIVAVRGTK